MAKRFNSPVTSEGAEREELPNGVVAIGLPIAELRPFDEVVVDVILDHSNPVTEGSVAVMRQGRLVFSRAYSAPGTSARAETTPDSLFRIASISKPITAVAIMVLVESGRLQLADRLVDCIEWAKHIDPRVTEITVEHVLRHQGGWASEISGDVMFNHSAVADGAGKSADELVPRDYVDFMANVGLDFGPGSDTHYSNFGFLLLGEIIEAVTDQSYEEFVRERVFAPLGIADAHLAMTSRADCHPHEVSYLDPIESPYDNFRLEPMKAHGGWVMCAADVARFGHLVTTGSAPGVVTDASIRAMCAPRVEAPGSDPAERFNGLGWAVLPRGDAVTTWHLGSLPGTTSLLINRWDGLTWVLLLNGRGGQDFALELDRALAAAADAIPDEN